MADNNDSQEVTNALILTEIRHMREGFTRDFGNVNQRLSKIEEKQTETGKWIAAHDEKTNSMRDDIDCMKKGIEDNRKRTTTMAWAEGVIAIVAGIGTFLGIK